MNTETTLKTYKLYCSYCGLERLLSQQLTPEQQTCSHCKNLLDYYENKSPSTFDIS